MKPTFKEVPSETATGQVVCDVRGSADKVSGGMFVAACLLMPFWVGCGVWKLKRRLVDETDLQGSAV